MVLELRDEHRANAVETQPGLGQNVIHQTHDLPRPAPVARGKDPKKATKTPISTGPITGPITGALNYEKRTKKLRAKRGTKKV